MSFQISSFLSLNQSEVIQIICFKQLTDFKSNNYHKMQTLKDFLVFSFLEKLVLSTCNSKANLVQNKLEEA